MVSRLRVVIVGVQVPHSVQDFDINEELNFSFFSKGSTVISE